MARSRHTNRAYRTHALTDKDAHDLIIRSTDVGACSNRLVPAVLNEWRQPRYDAFHERNVWSLFNAFTEAFKEATSLFSQREQRHSTL